MSTAFDWERTIFIYGRAGVDEDDSTTQHVSVKEVTEQMAGFASRPDDVTLMLHSLGGTYDGVMEILSFEHLVPFRTNVFSLVVAWERRLATKNAEFWYHRPSHYVHGHDDGMDGVGRYLEFRELADINEVVRRAFAYQSESDAGNSMLSIPLLMKAGVVTEAV